MSKLDLTQFKEFKAPYIATQDVVLRTIAMERKPSKAGNDMLEGEHEIAAPDSITIDGKTVKIAGLKVRDWIVLGETGYHRLAAYHKACELTTEPELDAANKVILNVPKDYVGKAFIATINTDPKPVKDNQTGEPVLNPETGEPEVRMNYRVKKYKGPSAEHTIPASAVAY